MIRHEEEQCHFCQNIWTTLRDLRLFLETILRGFLSCLQEKMKERSNKPEHSSRNIIQPITSCTIGSNHSNLRQEIIDWGHWRNFFSLNCFHFKSQMMSHVVSVWVNRPRFYLLPGFPWVRASITPHRTHGHMDVLCSSSVVDTFSPSGSETSLQVWKACLCPDLTRKTSWSTLWMMWVDFIVLGSAAARTWSRQWVWRAEEGWAG